MRHVTVLVERKFIFYRISILIANKRMVIDKKYLFRKKAVDIANGIQRKLKNMSDFGEKAVDITGV